MFSVFSIDFFLVAKNIYFHRPKKKKLKKKLILQIEKIASKKMWFFCSKKKVLEKNIFRHQKFFRSKILKKLHLKWNISKAELLTPPDSWDTPDFPFCFFSLIFHFAFFFRHQIWKSASQPRGAIHIWHMSSWGWDEQSKNFLTEK